NGAGKTSIISVIVSLEEPSKGQVRVFGHDIVKEFRKAKSLTGLVPQELVNHGYFNIEEVLHFYSGYFGIRKNKERIDYLLHRLSLYEHRHKKVKQLSGGMKRRLLIAKSLVHSPQLLLLDEPTAGVDIELRESLWSFVRDLKKEGVSILLTTHYLEEAEQLCDRVAIIDRGQLKKIGSTKDLVRGLTHRMISFQLKKIAEKISHPMLVSQSDQNLEFRVPASMGLGDLLGQLKLDVSCIMDLQIREGNLEDAFRLVLDSESQPMRQGSF
ncbi:MAG: ABC transporter ATP-binding protein, partial [Bdellovibrionales bacterium]|nr:ABC transporter ATP-binding protein [Bdellovibrionales bacterium]